MSLVSKVELKTVELPDALEFTVSREDGLLESVAFPVFAFFVLWMFWRMGTLWIHILAGIAAASTSLTLLVNWIQGGETKLRVTRDEIRAEGNLGQLFSTSVTIPATDVTSIRFDNGGDGGISGLYVRHGWRFTPVLPRLTAEQSKTVIEAIRQKFPEIPADSGTKFSLSSLFESGAELTTLNLSNSSTEDLDKPH
ncbi:hypothetical protein P8935_21385 [Telmatobacter sp. DSM 110680]|uniref:PH domain-containing protein n=1 Tax=Telmatobacter sp. DSM 110680 TaxID=3036704 RepID=A0AAU7DGD6_9BACT